MLNQSNDVVGISATMMGAQHLALREASLFKAIEILTECSRESLRTRD